ncbi:DHS-like NAD/FAD-binding domain-containing protein [Mycena floridula]|nr:DHS-like NAD/FAD-binding domain-containing protein [Mycena floridula]
MSNKFASPTSAQSNKPTPKTLEARDLESLVKYIKSDQCKNVVLMLGAGVSTSAGIPDFRSPKTGLYANLARLKLPHPEAVFDIGFFRGNPGPFYTLAREIYPGKYRPTIAHSFVRLLAEKSRLSCALTQNIDTLERLAGVPAEKIVEAHGSFASQRCIECKAPYDDQKMKAKIMAKEIPRCEKCHKGLVKPDIVFFGESLPREFFDAIPKLGTADLLIVMGTSLVVHPFASLAGLTREGCPRVLINLERVGDFGRHSDDVVLLGKCDDIVKELCQELGWEEELNKLWEATAISAPSDDPEFHEDPEDEDLYQEADTDEIDTLAEKMGVSLVVADVAEKIQSKQDKEVVEQQVVQGEKLPTAQATEDTEKP